MRLWRRREIRLLALDVLAGCAAAPRSPAQARLDACLARADRNVIQQAQIEPGNRFSYTYHDTGGSGPEHIFGRGITQDPGAPPTGECDQFADAGRGIQQKDGRRTRGGYHETPKAGPMAWATLNPVACSVTAEGNSRGSTSSGTRASQAGALSAPPTPSRKVSARRG